MSDLGRCGANVAGVKVGCGEPFVYEGERFRCVECETVFHKRCIEQHFKRTEEDRGATIMALSGDVARLTAALAAALRERDEAREALGEVEAGQNRVMALLRERLPGFALVEAELARALSSPGAATPALAPPSDPEGAAGSEP